MCDECVHVRMYAYVHVDTRHVCVCVPVLCDVDESVCVISNNCVVLCVCVLQMTALYVILTAVMR